MTTTCKLIAKNVLGSSAASVTFSSIPAAYTDLLVAWSARSSRAAALDYVQIRFNGATSDADLTYRSLYGTGSAALSLSGSNASVGAISADSATASTFGSGEAYIPNYAGSANKSVSGVGVSERNDAAATIWAAACVWANTAAINEIILLPQVGPNFLTGSSFYLYGITKA